MEIVNPSGSIPSLWEGKSARKWGHPEKEVRTGTTSTTTIEQIPVSSVRIEYAWSARYFLALSHFDLEPETGWNGGRSVSPELYIPPSGAKQIDFNILSLIVVLVDYCEVG